MLSMYIINSGLHVCVCFTESIYLQYTFDAIQGKHTSITRDLLRMQCHDGRIIIVHNICTQFLIAN